MVDAVRAGTTVLHMDGRARQRARTVYSVRDVERGEGDEIRSGPKERTSFAPDSRATDAKPHSGPFAALQHEHIYSRELMVTAAHSPRLTGASGLSNGCLSVL